MGATRGIEFSGVFGGTYVMVRYQRASEPAKIELYQIVEQGLEMFRGYVPTHCWKLQAPCSKCGASALDPCTAIGLVTTKGRVMDSVHAARKRLAA